MDAAPTPGKAQAPNAAPSNARRVRLCLPAAMLEVSFFVVPFRDREGFGQGGLPWNVPLLLLP
jgi:hypothetical protein